MTHRSQANQSSSAVAHRSRALIALGAVCFAIVALSLAGHPLARTALANQSTPAPTFTPRVAPSPTLIPDLSVVLPPLYQKLVADLAEVDKFAREALTLLQKPDDFNASILQSATDRIKQIQALRNQVMMTNLRSVTDDVRNAFVAPAYRAFITYANSLIRLIELQIDANNQHIALLKVASNEISAANAKLEAAKKKSADQQKIVTQRRSELDQAMTDYAILTSVEAMRGQAGARTYIVPSNDNASLRLADGRYKVWVTVAPGSTVKLTLIALKDSARTPLATDGQTQAIIQLAPDEYRIEAEGKGWWVVGFDPDAG